MTDWLYNTDLSLFRWVNQSLANPVGDVLFPFLTELQNFTLIYAFAILGFAFLGKQRDRVMLLLLLIVILIGDQLSSSVIKPLVGRLRPCAVLDNVRLLVPCGPGKSFPSSHAVNNFAMAFLAGRYYRRAAPYLFAYAFLVALSRVYIGVHYPADIVAGALLGCAVGWGVIVSHNALFRALNAKRPGSRIHKPGDIKSGN